MKKIIALLLSLVLVTTLAACGAVDETPQKLVIWSFTDELQTEGDVENYISQYTGPGQKYEGMEVEYVIIPTDDYLTAILPALRAGTGAPDVFTGELDMIQNFMEGGFLADLDALIEADPDLNYNQVKDDFSDYIWEAGIDPEDGILKALSWQVTPGMIFFKTDMAAAVWGAQAGFPSTNAPGVYSQLVSDWVSTNKFNSLQGLLEASEEVKAYNPSWRLFPDDSSIRHFARGSDQGASWLTSDGTLNPQKITEQITYMDTVAGIYGSNISDSLTANAGEWSGEWFAGMGSELVDASGETYQVMAYSLPTWGLFYVIAPNVEYIDSNGDACGEDKTNCVPKGNWGMASGPNSYFWGGTYLGVRSGSKNQEAAFDFIKSMILDNDYLLKRSANGDVYSVTSVMNAVRQDYPGNNVLGGMNHYDAFLAEASKISFENVTKYDRQLDTLFGKYVDAYKRGEAGAETLEQALNSFYQELRVTIPAVYRTGLPLQQ